MPAARQWFGLVGGPIAWGLEILLVVYVSPECARREGILIAGTIVLALVAVAACVVSYGIWHRAEDTPADLSGGSGRSTFFAVGGFYIGAISVFVILAVVLSTLILGKNCS